MKNATRLLAPFLAILAVGCSSDSTGIGTITDAQAQAMASALFSLTQNAGTAAASAAPSAAQASPSLVTVQNHVQLDAPCPLGGTVGLDANLSGSADSTSMSITYGLVETPQACVARDDKSGMSFVFDGAPNLTANSTLYTNFLDTLSLNGTYTGAVDWSSDAGSGTCSIDMAFDGMWNPADSTGTVSLQGSVCNVQVQTSTTVSS